jgi:ribose-phosphate pyrophosphokinase
MIAGYFRKGPIQLYALPGAEEYVKNVAKWIAKEFLNEIKAKNIDMIEYFYMDQEEIELYKKFYGKDEEFLIKYLTGEFLYFTHRNGAIEISIKNSARRRDVFVFHTFSEVDIVDYNGKNRHVSMSDQELLLYNTLDAFLEAKVNKVTIFEMNLGQARSDRPKGRGACNLRTFFRNITANGADHFFTFQIHSSKSLIGIDNTRTKYDNLGGQSLLIKYLLNNHIKTLDYYNNVVLNEWVFSSVDAGGKEFAAEFAKSFKTPLLVVDKRRNPITNVIEEITILKPESLSLQNKTVFVVDDMIDSGGSIVDVCKKYKDLGVKEVNIAAFYGLFSPPAEDKLKKLVEEKVLNRVIVTDLVNHSPEFYKNNPYIEVVDTTYTAAQIIVKTNLGMSLEGYFLPFQAEQYLIKKKM